jgi:RNA polymerase sigma-70 factor (ECF subfamily)
MTAERVNIPSVSDEFRAAPEPVSAGWPRGSARFDTTRWTLIAEAGADGPGREAALAAFCQTYWYPLYAFLRRRGESAEDARDLVQGFFTQMIERGWLAGVEKRTTRFSTLLLTILDRYLTSEYRRAAAAKRGGPHLCLIDLAEAEQWFEAEPTSGESPEQIFERRWAVAVLESALGRLRDENRAAGRGRHFDTLAPFLSREPAPGDYESAAQTLGLTRRAVAVAVHRLRRDFREAMRTEVAAGLRDATRVEEEMRALAAALCTA